MKYKGNAQPQVQKQTFTRLFICPVTDKKFQAPVTLCGSLIKDVTVLGSEK
jgi:hypothetical protein